jgi:hypothetical protein
VCAHLPLALRIAASRLANAPSWDIAGFVEAQNAIDPLAMFDIGGDGDGAVRMTLDQSYRTPPPAARHLVRRLSMVPGPECTLAAIAASSAARWRRRPG